MSKGLYKLIYTFVNNQACYANLEQLYSLPISNIDKILKFRKVSLKNPWVEKLGYMLGHCFNRIATDNYSKADIDELYINEYKNDKLMNYLKNTNFSPSNSALRYPSFMRSNILNLTSVFLNSKSGFLYSKYS